MQAFFRFSDLVQAKRETEMSGLIICGLIQYVFLFRGTKYGWWVGGGWIYTNICCCTWFITADGPLSANCMWIMKSGRNTFQSDIKRDHLSGRSKERERERRAERHLLYGSDHESTEGLQGGIFSTIIQRLYRIELG